MVVLIQVLNGINLNIFTQVLYTADNSIKTQLINYMRKANN